MTTLTAMATMHGAKMLVSCCWLLWHEQRLAYQACCGVLQELAESVGLQKQGLRSLAAATLQYQLAKGDQCSDWQRLQLTAQCAPPSLAPPAISSSTCVVASENL